MMKMQSCTDPEYALLFRTLSDETRIRIVRLLSEGELCACQLLESLTVSQPTLSYHMKILIQVKLVSARRQGTWMWYSLKQHMFDAAVNFLRQALPQHNTKDL